MGKKTRTVPDSAIRQQHPPDYIEMGQQHPLGCALNGAQNRPNLTLHWLAHTKVKYEFSPGEVSWGLPS